MIALLTVGREAGVPTYGANLVIGVTILTGRLLS